MKSPLLVFLLCLCGYANATNYYFSATGNDGAAGTSPATAWQTISKFNSFFSSLQPGDSVLFKRGDTFSGAMNISRSGSSSSPIIIGAYGSGAKPIITAFATVSGWTNSGNIWTSNTAVSTLSRVNIVVINNVNTPMGRWPNTGYGTIDSHVGNYSITDNSLPASPNWTGAEVVIRRDRWTIDRSNITSHSGNTINYSPIGYDAIDGFGYFVQGSASTLDVQNEWYYNPSTKKIQVYSTSSPSNVLVSTVDNLVSMSGRSYISFDNLAFQGANNNTFQVSGGNNITIKYCDIDFSGYNGINTSANPTLVQYSTINHSNNNGIYAGGTNNITVSNNTISNSGFIAGAGGNQADCYIGVLATGSNVLIEYNQVINTGYNGIEFNGQSTIVRNNFLNTFCAVKDDGAGIYTWNDGGSPVNYTGRKIQNNIIINGIGAGEGTDQSGQALAEGIYLDDNSANVDITGNSVANCGNNGLYIHNAHEVLIRDNNFYNNTNQIDLTQDNIPSNPSPIANLTIRNNTLFARNSSQWVLSVSNRTGSGVSFGSYDSNYYTRPINEASNITACHSGSCGSFPWPTYNLPGWKTLSGQDAHTNKAPVTVTTVNDLRFEYNETASPKTISLGANYIDVRNILYPGTITLQPYTSAILIKTSSGNIPPTANAGPNQTITLPTNTVTLSGSGTDPDGNIVAYLWTKISGPAAGTITSPNSATTTVTGMVQGVYQFELRVTDNNGAFGRDTMQVTVNPAANIPPVAIAGPNQVITLPTNTVTLSGSGSDADGNITAYLWTKISGPAAGTITNPNSATTTVTAMVQGVYLFELRVTDNNGAFGRDTMQVTVNPAANIPPVAIAGPNQVITLPTNSVTLSGSGTDADGNITAYLWTKVSGPAGTITNPNSATTTVTGMVQGVYQFELRVTDNNGAFGRDTMQVTVNPAANVPPVAIAGPDQVITLPTNTVTLSGSGSDPDGNITAYLWTKISGPAAGTITSPNSATTTVTGMVQGVYQFELRVTDNNGAFGRDTMQVTVNPAANIPPTANAGPNQTITLPTNTVTLSGSGTDADGNITAYLWTKISGPAAGTITNPNSATTTVTGMVQGVYQFELRVTDNNGAFGRDTMQVTVNPAANIPPVAIAGVDQTITLPTNTVTLSGSGSDADGNIVAYLWTKISGPAGTITNPNSATTTVTGMVQGVYQFELRVTDNNGAFGRDTMQVTVNPAANIPPTANAGPNQTITLPTNTVTLSGSGSDPDGNITAYLWTKISGPAGTITNPNSATTTVTGMVQGVYQFELRVTDNNGAFGRDTMQVTVNPAANIPPVAIAGVDQTITLPTNTVTLSGSGSDADGNIVAYLWTKISGPAGTITNPNSATTTVTGMVQGVYQFELRVTDNNGAFGRDTMQVTVNPAANIPPTANAGPNQTITLPTNTVTLSGSGSDPDGNITAYLWTKISGPAGTITNPNSATTTVTGMVQGVYQFELRVTDNNGAFGRDTMQVTVNPAANIPPVAIAGVDQTITLPTNTVTLSGSGSDADGNIVAYLWTKISGPAGTITNPNSATTTVTGMVQGVYQFELRVTDNNGAFGRDTMQVTVNPAANIPPTANAGPNQTITLPTNTVTLSGSGSDPDGNITAYLWTKISGPAGTITNPNSATTTVTGMVQGVYQFELRVTDNNGAFGRDTMQVTVNPAANIPPVAIAGPDQVITLPTNTVTLSGSGTDADGNITAYLWTKISGPAGTITSPNSATTTVTGMVQGVYQFELRVTDNNGAFGRDTMQVTVNPAANIPPTANAGPNQTITLPTNTVTLSGSGSDPDGNITAYLWTKISGPAAGTITNPNSATTTVTGMVQGVYQFELRVTDNNGAFGRDTMQVTVNPAANIPPTANAGVDQTITLPTNTVTLSGSGTDADGNITAYLWTKISGPAGTITSPNSATTTVTGMVQGVYQFELRVTDNNGAFGRDTMQVTVNPAANIPPTANAGPNQTITLPTNTVTLSGSGSDPDGNITAYLWTKISGPAAGTITNPNSATTTVTGMVQGVYQFELRVTDNNGAFGRDTMQVTVNPAANIPPTANAGPNQTITLPTNTVTLSGSGTDADGNIVAYLWTKISGPAAGTITSPNSATTTVTGMVQGVYQFELRVTDNNGAFGRDTIEIITNTPPTAIAGSDQTVMSPTTSTVNSVGVAGSGIDPDGTIVAYNWTKVSGPASGSVTNPNSAATSITGLVVGTYNFELRVTDNYGAYGRDTMRVTISAPPNVLPNANAGPDQTITLPLNNTSLTGSGSDFDGMITGYAWIQLSGPSNNVLFSPNTAVAYANNLVAGIYEFELTVTDDRGGKDRDTVRVTVNAIIGVPPTTIQNNNNSIKVYPNPVVTNTTLEINKAKADTKVKVMMIDAQGKVILTKELPSQQTHILELINMSALAKGTYVVTVFFGEKEIRTLKVIKAN